MKLNLLRIGKFYIRLDIPMEVTELLLGFETLSGMYTVCIDETFTDCFACEFTEMVFGFLVVKICIGKEKEIDQNQFNNLS